MAGRCSEKPAIVIEQSERPPIMNINGNDLVVYAVDVVVVVEVKMIAVASVLACDLAAVEAVVGAFAEGILQVAQRRGLLE